MPFQIIEILDSQPQSVLARVSHQGNQVTALVANRGGEDVVAGKSVEAEIGYDKILSWEVIPDFDDTKSGIWQDQDGIHLLGRIHSLLDFGDGKTIVDVYVQNGSELFQVDLEAIEDAALESGSGLEITVSKLFIYPNDK